eukprot:gene5354-6827_t
MILLEQEAAYAIAMLQEMFHQIDYNGDGTVDWDEFTTFCIQNVQNMPVAAPAPAPNAQSNNNGGVGSGGGGAGSSNPLAENDLLDQYFIEYVEEVGHRDTTLNSFLPIANMRHVPEAKRLIVVPEDSDHVILFDDRFNHLANISPAKVKGTAGALGDAPTVVTPTTVESRTRIVVYDAVFLAGKDLYAYSASDHAITVCKEQSSAGGRNMHYFEYSKLVHDLLQLKLCWSQRSRILCSVGTDRVIYGWDVDTKKLLFNVSRHEDVITDFH